MVFVVCDCEQVADKSRVIEWYCGSQT